MTCSTLNPPKVISEMPSSLFLRHTAIACGTKSRALQSSPKAKITATNSFIPVLFPHLHLVRVLLVPVPAPETGKFDPTSPIFTRRSCKFFHLTLCFSYILSQEPAIRTKVASHHPEGRTPDDKDRMARSRR